MTLEDDLALAHELADAADAITLARFRALDLVVESKPDLTPVSDADTRGRAGDPAHAGLPPARPTRCSARRTARPAPARAAGSSTRSTGPRTSCAASRSGPRSIALQEDGEVDGRRRQRPGARPPLVGRPRRSAPTPAGRSRARAPAAGQPRRRGSADASVAYSSLTGWERAGPAARAAAAVRATSGAPGRTATSGRTCWSPRARSTPRSSPRSRCGTSPPLQVVVEEAGGRFTDLAGRRPAGRRQRRLQQRPAARRRARRPAGRPSLSQRVPDRRPRQAGRPAPRRFASTPARAKAQTSSSRSAATSGPQRGELRPRRGELGLEPLGPQLGAARCAGRRALGAGAQPSDLAPAARRGRRTAARAPARATVAPGGRRPLARRQPREQPGRRTCRPRAMRAG